MCFWRSHIAHCTTCDVTSNAHNLPCHVGTPTARTACYVCDCYFVVELSISRFMIATAVARSQQLITNSYITYNLFSSVKGTRHIIWRLAPLLTCIEKITFSVSNTRHAMKNANRILLHFVVTFSLYKYNYLCW